MVCMDGFLLTHASERADIPGQDEVDAFLPPYQPRQVLDPEDPVSIGAMVGPEAFTEVRFLADERMRQALELSSAVHLRCSRQDGLHPAELPASSSGSTRPRPRRAARRGSRSRGRGYCARSACRER